MVTCPTHDRIKVLNIGQHGLLFHEIIVILTAFVDARLIAIIPYLRRGQIIQEIFRACQYAILLR